MEPNNNFDPRIAKWGIRNGLLTALYVVAVASFIFYLPRSFDQQPNVMTFVSMLLLFMVSALITGSLVLWSPAKLLVQGKTNEAFSLLAVTGATLVILLIIAFVTRLLML